MKTFPVPRAELTTWQEGLVRVIFLVTTPFRKQIYFLARYMVQYLLLAMYVKGMSIENLPTTRDVLFSQRALSQPDSSLVTSQLAEPKSTPAWNQGMGDGRSCCNSISIHLGWHEKEQTFIVWFWAKPTCLSALLFGKSMRKELYFVHSSILC